MDMSCKEKNAQICTSNFACKKIAGEDLMADKWINLGSKGVNIGVNRGVNIGKNRKKVLNGKH